MTDSPVAALVEHFNNVKDPRAQHSIAHLLIDIVIITICGVICGADSCLEVESYGHAKQKWLSTFLALPNGMMIHMVSAWATQNRLVLGKCKVDEK
jgi:7-cyano-7-deazaguanine synthase in queuosine biosynthesis